MVRPASLHAQVLQLVLALAMLIAPASSALARTPNGPLRLASGRAMLLVDEQRCAEGDRLGAASCERTKLEAEITLNPSVIGTPGTSVSLPGWGHARCLIESAASANGVDRASRLSLPPFQSLQMQVSSPSGDSSVWSWYDIQALPPCGFGTDALSQVRIPSMPASSYSRSISSRMLARRSSQLKLRGSRRWSAISDGAGHTLYGRARWQLKLRFAN